MSGTGPATPEPARTNGRYEPYDRFAERVISHQHHGIDNKMRSPTAGPPGGGRGCRRQLCTRDDRFRIFVPEMTTFLSDLPLMGVRHPYKDAERRWPTCGRHRRVAAAGAWPSASFGPILGDMAGLKITPTSAMRARDVSRPRAEHLAAAAEREDAVTRRGDRPANAAIPAAIARSAARPAAVTAPAPTAPAPAPAPPAPGATAQASAAPVPSAPVPSAPVPSARKAATPPTGVEPAAMPLAGMPLAGAEPAGAEPATDGEPVDARRRRRGR
jgi:hypothetical protein